MNLKQQYQKLEAKKLWRIFKVAYFGLAILIWLGALLAFISSTYDVSYSLPYSFSDYVATGWWGLVFGVLLFLLYWLIKRLVAYMAYGKAERIM